MLAIVAFTQEPAVGPKDALRKQIAELKVKAFEIETEVQLLEQRLKDIETAEALAPVPVAAKAAPAKMRCAGHTKEGARCTRFAEAGSRYCWQHRKRR
jgi:hypothetical protein